MIEKLLTDCLFHGRDELRRLVDDNKMLRFWAPFLYLSYVGHFYAKYIYET